MRETLLGAALAVAVVLAVSTASTPRAEPPADPVIVADDGGPLREVVIHFDPRAEEAVAPTWRDLFRALPQTVKVWVVVERAEDMDRWRTLIEEWGVAAPERFHPVVTGLRITTWARDRFTLRKDGDTAVLLVPPRPTESNEARLNDWTAPFALAAARPFRTRVEVSRAVFDGGDLVASNSHVFATAVLRGRNLGGPLASPERLGSWMRTISGREPALLGTDPNLVPRHHICMLLTPIGGRTVLVGDAELGLALLPPDAPLPRPADRRPETIESFHRVARALEAQGFHVRRIPLVPLVDGLTYVSYNNALLERREGRLHVYLPQAGIEALDSAGRKAWEETGAVVHPIDTRGIYPWNGTVRCLVNVLDRGV